jgi:hypothetical protein
MRHLGQPQGLLEVRPFRHDRHNAAVIGLEKGHEHQQRKELLLGEIPAAEPAGVSRKGLAGNLHRLFGQRHRRTRHRSFGIHPFDIATLPS